MELFRLASCRNACPSVSAMSHAAASCVAYHLHKYVYVLVHVNVGVKIIQATAHGDKPAGM